MAPELLSTAGFVIVAYLLGSVPFGLLIGFALGIDIRKTGSGNIGATNLSRAAGRKWGIVAFVLDFLKGFLPVVTAQWLATAHPDAFGTTSGGGLGIAVGLAAVLGHVFPIYLAFRGGKGVATTFGVMAGLSWLATLLAGAVWLSFYLATRAVSVGSMAAAIALPLAVALVERGRPRGEYLAVLGFSVAMGLLVLVRHRTNFIRLLRGEELKFGARK